MRMDHQAIWKASNAGTLQRALLYGRTAAEFEYNLADGFGERAVDRASTGAFVAAAAKALGDASDVKFAFAAQADAIPVVRQFAEKRGHLDATDGENIIHNSLAVFFESRRCAPSASVHPDVADMPFDLKIAQRFSEQLDLGDRVREINSTDAIRPDGSGQNQLACESEVFSFVPWNMNEPVSVISAVQRQIAISGENFTPASRAKRNTISAVATAWGSIQLTCAKGRPLT